MSQVDRRPSPRVYDDAIVRWHRIIPLTLVALVSAGHAAAEPTASHSHARVSLLQRSPLKVQGAGFHRHERVRVVARVGGQASLIRHVKARRSGRFVVSFGGQTSPPCGLLRVNATGSRGSRAVLRGIKLPDCVID
jgi:hypothetical protein